MRNASPPTPPPFLGAYFARNIYGHGKYWLTSFAEKCLTKRAHSNSLEWTHQVKPSMVMSWKWVLRRLVPEHNLFSPPPLIHITIVFPHRWFTSQPKKVSEKWNQILLNTINILFTFCPPQVPNNYFYYLIALWQ
jgi:hypothetical protein